ncbi:hypothetical protein F5Y10DRAFT_283931 [Nemania abortiva]|nr:hypothetical protein F5Y10DRAFT_283931 [Nemania abortiva]
MAYQRQTTADITERAVPEWSAAASKATTRTDKARLHDAEPMEFILSSNWALLSGGVKDFYEVLYKHDENLEIKYDPTLHAFRIKCLSEDEVKIVALVKATLDQLVQKENKSGLEKSTKIMSLEDWRKNKCRPGGEIKIPFKYMYPRDVAACNIQGTWNISEDWSKKGITTSKILPGSALSKLQRLTGTVLVPSSTGRTVYIGAPRAEGVANIKEKLDTLARLFLSKPWDMAQVIEIFLYNEGDRSTRGEYRFLADGNDGLLRSYILDRFDWPHTDIRYPAIFHKGVIVRLNPDNEPWEESGSISNTILPIVKDESAKEEFGAFKLNNWKYPSRDAVSSSVLLGSDPSMPQSVPSLAAHQLVLRPKIESWVSNIPAPGTNKSEFALPIDNPVGAQAPDIPVPGFRFCAATSRASRIDRNTLNLVQNPHVSTHDELSHFSAPHENARSEANAVGSLQSQQPEATGRPKPSQAFSTIDRTVRPSVVQSKASRNCLEATATPRIGGSNSVPSSNTNCRSDAAKPYKYAKDENTAEPTDSSISLGNGPAQSATLEQPKPEKHDPFEHLWREYRELTNTKSVRKNYDGQSDKPDVKVPRLDEEREPRLATNQETDYRSFHMTMNQKAGSRTVPGFPEFSPDMIISINKSLARLLSHLRMWSGFVDFRIDIGRFCFLNVKKSHIQQPGDDDDEKHYKLDRIRNELNKRHSASERLYFTRVLTTLGADANYIARMSDKGGSPMWHRPAGGRSSIYEFTCRSRTAEGVDLDFIVDIDTAKFTSMVKPFKAEQKCFAVHCTKRAWDFQIVLSVSEDLNDVCGGFVEDLVRSLRVMPKNDRIPELDVSYDKNYNIEILAVRTRNTACCTPGVGTTNTNPTRSSLHKDQRLYISEVWEMDRLSRVEGTQHIQLKFARYKESDDRPDTPLVWYEAALRSDTFSTAFQQNEKLEFGSEAKWTPEELYKSGAVDELVQKAADMVKNMDGVGYWNDNHQKELLRSVVPVAKPTRNQNVRKFW